MKQPTANAADSAAPLSLRTSRVLESATNLVMSVRAGIEMPSFCMNFQEWLLWSQEAIVTSLRAN